MKIIRWLVLFVKRWLRDVRIFVIKYILLAVKYIFIVLDLQFFPCYLNGQLSAAAPLSISLFRTMSALSFSHIMHCLSISFSFVFGFCVFLLSPSPSDICFWPLEAIDRLNDFSVDCCFFENASYLSLKAKTELPTLIMNNL